MFLKASATKNAGACVMGCGRLVAVAESRQVKANQGKLSLPERIN